MTPRNPKEQTNESDYLQNKAYYGLSILPILSQPKSKKKKKKLSQPNAPSHSEKVSQAYFGSAERNLMHVYCFSEFSYKPWPTHSKREDIPKGYGKPFLHDDDTRHSEDPVTLHMQINQGRKDVRMDSLEKIPNFFVGGGVKDHTDFHNLLSASALE